jgi:hypothetical protein
MELLGKSIDQIFIKKLLLLLIIEIILFNNKVIIYNIIFCRNGIRIFK